MERRFQVFVSSTFEDLSEIRQELVRTLLQMDCFPAGMELFPAVDEEQWQFIKQVMDDCDYYLLIIAGRYGSLAPEGLSYTEKEFDYAVERGLHVMAFVHGDPEAIPSGKTESDPAMKEKLAEFREKVCRDRVAKFWTSETELPALVTVSLVRAMKKHPALGWVRGGPDTTDLLQQVNELRKRNDVLQAKVDATARAQHPVIPDLASGEDVVQLMGTYAVTSNSGIAKWRESCSWNGIMGYIGPGLFQWMNEKAVNSALARAVLWKKGIRPYMAHVDDEPFNTVKLQLLALGYIDIRSLQTLARSWSLFWLVTPLGKRVLLELRTLRKSPPTASDESRPSSLQGEDGE